MLVERVRAACLLGDFQGESRLEREREREREREVLFTWDYAPI